MVSDAIPDSCTLKDIGVETEKDVILRKVIKILEENSNWLKKDEDIKLYYNVRDELLIANTPDGRILLKSNLIVIPEVLRQAVLEVAHSSHLGIVKTKELLREKFGGQK